MNTSPNRTPEVPSPAPARPASAIDLLLLSRVQAYGGHAFEVGGGVRDALLGLENKDHDYLITGVSIAQMDAVFAGDDVNLVGESFGVYKIRLAGQDEVIDVALPRTEHSTGTGRRDFEVQCDPDLSVEDDLARRDFTVNAVARDLETGRFIDPFGGLADLDARLLRFVGVAEDRIREDPLRVLRAYRFMVKLGFRLHPDTERALRSNAHVITSLPVERVWQELWTMLNYPHASREALQAALDAMLAGGALQEMIPEYQAVTGYDQHTPYHHLTLERHMTGACAAGQAIGASGVTKLALLLHDLGKPATRSISEDGRAHYYGHELVGVDLARTVLDRLKAPAEVNAEVQTLIRHHMRLSPSHPVSDRTLRRYMNDHRTLWREGLKHRAADLEAHAGDMHPGAPDPADWLADLITRGEAQPEDTATLTQAGLKLTGEAIMQVTGLAPGRQVGQVKCALVQEVIEGAVENTEGALSAYLDTHLPHLLKGVQ